MGLAALFVTLVLSIAPTAKQARADIGTPKAAITTDSTIVGFVLAQQSAAQMLSNRIGDRSRLLLSDFQVCKIPVQKCGATVRGKLQVGIKHFVAIQPHAPEIFGESNLSDCLGNVIVDAVAFARSDSVDEPAAVRMTADLALQFSSLVARQRSRIDGMRRFGVGLAQGERSAFFSLAASGTQPFVGFALPKGTAAQAGIRLGDHVVSVDGYPTSGLTQMALDKLIAFGNSVGRFNVVVARGAGNSMLTFNSEPAWWYASHYRLGENGGCGS